MAYLATYSLPWFSFYGNVMERMYMRPLSFPCTRSRSHARKMWKDYLLYAFLELQYPNSNTEKCFSQLLLASRNHSYFSPLFSIGRRAERRTAGYRDSTFGCHESPAMHKGDKKAKRRSKEFSFRWKFVTSSVDTHYLSWHFLSITRSIRRSRHCQQMPVI